MSKPGTLVPYLACASFAQKEAAVKVLYREGLNWGMPDLESALQELTRWRAQSEEHTHLYYHEAYHYFLFVNALTVNQMVSAGRAALMNTPSHFASYVYLNGFERRARQPEVQPV